MAITISHGGSNIRKPGSYSTSEVEQGGSPVGTNGTMLIVGEAEGGAPGSTVGFKRYTPAQLGDLLANYKSGPIVDTVLAANRPAAGGQEISRPNEYVIWKTNDSGQASLTLQTSAPADLIDLNALNYGKDGNKIAVTVTDGTTPAQQKVIKIERGTTVETLSENPATAQLSLQYTGGGSAATITISGASKSQKKLTSSITGGSSDEDLDLLLEDYTISELQGVIDATPGWTATLQNTATGTVINASDLDPISGEDVTSSKSLYRLQEELVGLVNDESSLVEAVLKPNVEGIPATLSKTSLSGGSTGSSANSDFSDGFSKSLGIEWNVAVPAISRDATDDITDGLTDSGSSYTIDSVITALNSHLILRGSVKNRKEAQGIVGKRGSTVADLYEDSRNVGSHLIQYCIQDVLVLDKDSNLSWKFPHVMAGKMAGVRLGSEVGEPLTHKFLNVNGIGHVVNSDTGLDTGDFDPDTDFDQAIDAGILFAESAQGGIRVVVDNTTYGIDQSFIFNRGSVVEAAQFIEKDIRRISENIFVGNKVSKGLASSIKSQIRARLIQLNDENITSASQNAPKGFVEDSLSVVVSGNTVDVSVEVKPVQGVDFIRISFTLGNIQQSA